MTFFSVHALPNFAFSPRISRSTVTIVLACISRRGRPRKAPSEPRWTARWHCDGGMEPAEGMHIHSRLFAATCPCAIWTLDYLQLDRGASAPAARGGHAIASIGSRVICFGGADRSPTPFSDLWELDTGTCLSQFLTWNSIGILVKRSTGS